jgi:hypothetical protein
MGLIGRFTRDSASKYVWSLMTLAAVVGLVYAVTRGWEEVEAERLASHERALDHVNRVIDPRLDGPDLAAPLTGETLHDVEAAVGRSILRDERVDRVRIWSTDGVLLFSTDRSDRPGSRAGLNDPVLREVSRDGPLTRTGLSDTGGADDPERSLLRTYVPFGGDAVVEIDQTAAGTLGPVRSEWFYYQLLFGGAALLFLILTALSLREPVDPINAGVPFAASSVPAGYSLIDNDRREAVEEVYRLASERVERLKRKLADSEEARRRLEGDIQRTLTEVATGVPQGPSQATPPDPPAAEAPVAEPPTPDAPAAVPETDVVQLPESEVVSEPPGSSRPAGPLARAARDQKPPPARSRREKQAPTPKAKRAPKRSKAEPREVPEAPAEREAEPAPVAAAPAQEVETIEAKAAKRDPAAISDPETADAEAHEAALETFIRLTESDRQQHETGDVDQGAVRAALALTAARKKPGGEGLHRNEAEQPRERPGGPPPNGRD